MPIVAVIVAGLWCTASFVEARARFGEGRAIAAWSKLWRPLEPWRVVGTYPLFGPITTHRDELEFQVHEHGRWRPLAMRAKPGPLARGGVFVQPHQPRVEFQLWFVGLSWTEGMPGWVRRLLEHLCTGDELVQPLFAD